MLRCLLGECSGKRAARYTTTNRNIRANKNVNLKANLNTKLNKVKKKLNTKLKKNLAIGMTNNPGATGERTNRNIRANKRVKLKAKLNKNRSPSSPIAHRTRSRTRARL
jgi:hypothetical protein